MDNISVYAWGGQTKHLSRREIDSMKKNMKKVPVIQLKAEVYHNKEAVEADAILGKITQPHTAEPTQEQVTLDTIKLPRYKKIAQRFYTHFNSFF